MLSRIQVVRGVALAFLVALVGFLTLLLLPESEACGDDRRQGHSGGKISFAAWDNSIHADNFGVHVMNADGSCLIMLPGATISAVEWSPDGRRFGTTLVGSVSNRDIYVVNSDGSNLTQLTDHRYAEANPTWSPDGSRIAYTRMDNGFEDIFVMKADGSGQVNLTNHRATDRVPHWSPDGTRIAFYSDRDGDEDIFVMNADGSNLINLTSDLAGRIFFPGRRMVASFSSQDLPETGISTSWTPMAAGGPI